MTTLKKRIDRASLKSISTLELAENPKEPEPETPTTDLIDDRVYKIFTKGDGML